jgi:hypothetical protein
MGQRVVERLDDCPIPDFENFPERRSCHTLHTTVYQQSRELGSPEADPSTSAKGWRKSHHLWKANF